MLLLLLSQSSPGASRSSGPGGLMEYRRIGLAMAKDILGN